MRSVRCSNDETFHPITTQSIEEKEALKTKGNALSLEVAGVANFLRLNQPHH